MLLNNLLSVISLTSSSFMGSNVALHKPDGNATPILVQTDLHNNNVGAALELEGGNGNILAKRSILKKTIKIDKDEVADALQVAAGNGDFEVVTYILSEHWNIGVSSFIMALKMAAEKGHLDVVESILSGRLDILASDIKEARDLAYDNGHADVEKYLHREQGKWFRQME